MVDLETRNRRRGTGLQQRRRRRRRRNNTNSGHAKQETLVSTTTGTTTECYDYATTRTLQEQSHNNVINSEVAAKAKRRKEYDISRAAVH
jgi:hypothetical protein